MGFWRIFMMCKLGLMIGCIGLSMVSAWSAGSVMEINCSAPVGGADFRQCYELVGQVKPFARDDYKFLLMPSSICLAADISSDICNPPFECIRSFHILETEKLLNCTNRLSAISSDLFPKGQSNNFTALVSEEGACLNKPEDSTALFHDYVCSAVSCRNWYKNPSEELRNATQKYFVATKENYEIVRAANELALNSTVDGALDVLLGLPVGNLEHGIPSICEGFFPVADELCADAHKYVAVAQQNKWLKEQANIKWRLGNSSMLLSSAIPDRTRKGDVAQSDIALKGDVAQSDIAEKDNM
jgi:hypothetical protein